MVANVRLRLHRSDIVCAWPPRCGAHIVADNWPLALPVYGVGRAPADLPTATCQAPVSVSLPSSAQLAGPTSQSLPVAASVVLASCVTVSDLSLVYTWSLTSLDTPANAISSTVVAALGRTTSAIRLPAYSLVPGTYKLAVHVVATNSTGAHLPNGTANANTNVVIAAVAPVAQLTRGGASWLVSTTEIVTLNGTLRARVLKSFLPPPPNPAHTPGNGADHAQVCCSPIRLAVFSRSPPVVGLHGRRGAPSFSHWSCRACGFFSLFGGWFGRAASLSVDLNPPGTGAVTCGWTCSGGPCPTLGRYASPPRWPGLWSRLASAHRVAPYGLVLCVAPPPPTRAPLPQRLHRVVQRVRPHAQHAVPIWPDGDGDDVGPVLVARCAKRARAGTAARAQQRGTR